MPFMSLSQRRCGGGGSAATAAALPQHPPALGLAALLEDRCVARLEPRTREHARPYSHVYYLLRLLADLRALVCSRVQLHRSTIGSARLGSTSQAGLRLRMARGPGVGWGGIEGEGPGGAREDAAVGAARGGRSPLRVGPSPGTTRVRGLRERCERKFHKYINTATVVEHMHLACTETLSFVSSLGLKGASVASFVIKSMTIRSLVPVILLGSYSAHMSF